jgi:hypothetical protein
MNPDSQSMYAGEEPSPLDGKLEPETKAMGEDTVALYSIAISLKRIADALHGDPQNTGMKHALADLADRAFNGWGPSS